MIDIINPRHHSNLADLIDQCLDIRKTGLSADSSTIGQLSSNKVGLEENDWLCEAHLLRKDHAGKIDGYLRLTDMDHISDLRKLQRSKDPASQEFSQRRTLEIERLCVDTNQEFRDPVDHWFMCVRDLMTQCLSVGLKNEYCLLAGYAEIPGLERLTKLGLPIVTHGRPVEDGSKWIYRFHLECSQENLEAMSHIKVVREAPTQVRMTTAASTNGLLEELASRVVAATPKQTLSSKLKSMLGLAGRSESEAAAELEPQRRWIGD